MIEKQIFSLSYDYPVHDNLHVLETNTDVLCSELKKIYGDRPISIACRGTSGILIATRLCAKLNNGSSILFFRKEHEKTHGSQPYRNWGDKPIVIVDDVCSSGRTLIEIVKEIGRMSGGHYTLEYVEVISVAGLTKDFLPLKDLPNLKYILS